MIILNGTVIYHNFNKNNKRNPINPKIYDAYTITQNAVPKLNTIDPIIANNNFIIQI